MTFQSVFLFFLFTGVATRSGNIAINKAAIELTKEQEEQFLADQKNPKATLFGENHTFIDAGQELLEQAFQSNKFLKAAVRFKWNGSEILCNCTSQFCGDPAILDILAGVNLTNVCLGLACYTKKRIFRDEENGETKRDTHMGCYGGDIETHDLHNHWEDMFCANTPYVSTRCCRESFCEFEDFPYPSTPFVNATSNEEEEDSKSLTNLCWGLGISSGVIASLVLVYFVHKRKRWLPLCIEKLLKAKRTETAFPMMDLSGNRFAAPIFPRTYHPLVDESGGDNTQSTSMGADSSDGHPLNRLLRDLDDSASNAAWSSSGFGGEIVPQSGFLGPIKIDEAIGQGRYGRVVKALWKGQVVAMKVITTYNEQSYYREITMYRAGLLRHTNILQFIGNEPMDNGCGLENCILFEYHELGSLDNYLNQNTIDLTTATRMIFSMASGLAFLHHATDSNGGGYGKPAIAHRDMKSANILVKKNLMTCISDLGLAVCQNQMDGSIGIPKPKVREADHFEMEQRKITERFQKCGTIRYLCPELLDNSFDFDLFEAYKAADVYALGLVVYETCRRTEHEGYETVPYEMAQPYFREIALNGGKTGEVDSVLMKRIVVEMKCRPEPAPWWDKNPVMKEIHALMNECWYLDPAARLTANNVIRKVERLAERGGIDLTQT